MSSQRTEQAIARLADLTPRQIVAELDRYIVGQAEAKKSVAIALRNRWRRQRAPENIRDEISPNNIILIGPTGVGKTEIARRLAKLAGAPFAKVEASKFTEVGYVGRDVESMVRDLVENAIDMVRTEREAEVEDLANEKVDDRILDLLLPPVDAKTEAKTEAKGDAKPDDRTESKTDGKYERETVGAAAGGAGVFSVSSNGTATQERKERELGGSYSLPTPPPAVEPDVHGERYRRTREKLRALLLDGDLDNREVEIEVTQSGQGMPEMLQTGGVEGMESITDWFREMLPKRTKKRTLKVSEARRILLDEELDKLIDLDDVTTDAVARTESMGIIFLDEIDKIAGERGPGTGADVSREGVQRDLLPIVEGSNVQTRHGMVKTDHVLFIAAGAFHVSKPSDLIPELQGRFPIRVELKSLTEADFVRIMTEPENALTKQYSALVESEGATLVFEPEGIAEIARTATRVNQRMENIGARRLHTVMTTLLEDVLYELPDRNREEVVVTAELVRERLKAISEDEDLRKYIL